MFLCQKDTTRFHYYIVIYRKCYWKKLFRLLQPLKYWKNCERKHLIGCVNRNSIHRFQVVSQWGHLTRVQPVHMDAISLIDLQVLWSLWDDLERVYEHVPREGDVEVTKPQELRAMAKHGFLKRGEGCSGGHTSHNMSCHSHQCWKCDA